MILVSRIARGEYESIVFIQRATQETPKNRTKFSRRDGPIYRNYICRYQILQKTKFPPRSVHIPVVDLQSFMQLAKST